MFESFKEQREGRGKRFLKALAVSFVFYFILISVILFVDFMGVEAVPQPPVTVTFVDYASLPPPPPPPPPPKKRSTKPKPEVKPTEVKPLPKIQEFMAPKEIPQEKAREPEEPEVGPDEGVEGGSDDGVVGGVIGGVIGGNFEPAPPPPPPPAAAPAYQAPEVIKKRRIAGSEPTYPRIARAAGLEATILVKIFITPEGEVGEIQFMKSDSHFEAVVREALKGWRFAPHMINGKAVGTFTVYKFVFKLE